MVGHLYEFRDIYKGDICHCAKNNRRPAEDVSAKIFCINVSQFDV
ncbi:hypothetical protein ADIS_2019 [Lunatimonas lonarensis]|uniref:Uncharacterized protein n=1 Tax=Lunatimonas lonarensis TaxID=1232681 RepID=R7ZU16_9BACT|nr:hypothetical protein ADIS_2019 [Lunatimonas lonarensis]